MGEEDETEPTFSKLKFPFLPLAPASPHSPEHPSGTVTPPLHTSASVPFKWEEEPGKPRPCTDLIALPEPATRSLEPPPYRIVSVEIACKIPKMPSPTTVLDGPYNVARPKFSSFRLFREGGPGSFDSCSSGGSPQSAADVLLGKKKKKNKTKGFFGRGKSGKKKVDEGNLGFSPCSVFECESDEKVKMMTRNGSFSSLSRATSTNHLWASICGGLKQAIPWKSTRKSKKKRDI